MYKEKGDARFENKKKRKLWKFAIQEGRYATIARSRAKANIVKIERELNYRKKVSEQADRNKK